ncbi:hypothetical protein [Yoonia algicola]|uniref:Lipoprotein n=1 Tax=Yoonia algicola TaxID=3137368 RepID=A0AAN0M2K2_9RHOB
MKIATVALAPVAIMMLANCTGSTNPAEATLFDNIANLQSGEYDSQLAAKEAQAQAIINANNATEGRINQMESQRASNAAVIASLRGQVADLRAEIGAAKGKMSGNAAATAQLNSLDSQAIAVQRDVEAGGDAEIARAELSRIRSAVRALSA